MQTFMDKRGCRMPWQESGGEVCDHVEFEAFLQALRSTPTLEKFVEMTGCVHSCETTVRKNDKYSILCGNCIQKLVTFLSNIFRPTLPSPPKMASMSGQT